MTVKKNSNQTYTPTIQLNLSQVFMAVITSLIIGGITGAFAIVRVSDSNTLVIAGNSDSIEKLEENSVSRREFSALSNQVTRIEQKVDRLLER